MMTEKIESIDLITVKEDFESIDEYNKLTPEQKDAVWEYAKRKLIDILCQDYDLCLEACVTGAIDNIEKWESI